MLKTEAEQLIKSLKNNLSPNSLKKFIAILIQIHVLNPDLANQLMLKMLQVIRGAVNSVVSNQSIQYAKACHSYLSECMVSIPSLRFAIQKITNELSNWINQEQVQPTKNTTQSQSGVDGQSFSVNYGGAYGTNFNTVIPNNRQATRPHPGKPIGVGGIFIQPYLELDLE